MADYSSSSAAQTDREKRMQSPTTGRARNMRSPLNNRRIAGGKEQLSKEEKTYREIMGPDGKVRAQF